MTVNISPRFRFLLFWLLSLVLFHSPLLALARLALNDSRYSHILALPLLAAFFLWSDRAAVFSAAHPSLRLGALLSAGALLLFFSSRFFPTAATLSVRILALILLWIAGFALCYGATSVRAAMFPCFFLLLIVPAPSPLVDCVVDVLRRGSSELAFLLFQLVGIPVFRQGYVFCLPGLTIEIAGECSSIRSGIALFLTSLVACRVFLRAPWRRACIVLITPLLAMFSNAIRILSLSALSLYVDRDFLYGRLHHRGGALFSLVSVVMLVLIAFALRRGDPRPQPRPAPIPGGSAFSCSR